MKILLIGSGGREHALAFGLLKDSSTTKLFIAPGNPGIRAMDSAERISAVNLVASDHISIVNFARENEIDLVVIGPEKPLVDGLADELRKAGLAVFGPNQNAALIEGSKDFAKQVMAESQIPTAKSFTCTNETEIDQALDFFAPTKNPFVVKDDGLAAGKGVVVTKDRNEAKAHALSCSKVVIEEYLAGPEFSLFGISDGRKVLPMQPAQDFKRIFDNDQGPNTGGMGSYSPLPWLSEEIDQLICQTILQPIITTLARMGKPFVGLLYAGLVLTNEGIKVIEFNARFGDPETQSLIPRLETPLAEVLHAAATGNLSKFESLNWSNKKSVTVVVASEGYPGESITGREISGDYQSELANEVFVFHSGTKESEGKLFSAGGRVLAITALGDSISEARNKCYEKISKISLENAQYRKDIAAQVLQND